MADGVNASVRGPRRYLAILPSRRGGWLGYLLVGAAFVGILLSFAPTFAEGENLSELRRRQQGLEEKRRLYRQKKYQALRQVRVINDQIVRNQAKLEAAQSAVITSQVELSRLEQRINALEGHLDMLQQEKNQLERQASKRVRSLYMGERLGLLEMFFSVDRLSTLLDRLYYWDKITRRDKYLLDRLRDKTRQIATQQHELGYSRGMKISEITRISSLQRQISVRIRSDWSLKNRYMNDVNTYERAENELISESRSIQSQIQGWIASQVKTTTPVTGSTGRISWPLRGPIMSYYGYRVHPIFRRRKYHTGIDISAPMGTPIRAADGGVVIYAGWRGGYGKVVILSHGNRGGRNIATLYGHMSSFAVGSGQPVGKGQVIGRVGSTGWSTGPHLHFEVRVNGATTDPLAWLR